MDTYGDSISYFTNIICYTNRITWLCTIGDLFNASLITTTQKCPGMWWSKVHCAFFYKAQAPSLDCVLMI